MVCPDFSHTLRPNCRGEDSGHHFAFLYPDLSTALVGEWREGVLVAGRAARLAGCTVEEGGLVPSFTVTGERQGAVGAVYLFIKSKRKRKTIT